MKLQFSENEKIKFKNKNILSKGRLNSTFFFILALNFVVK